MLIGILGYLAVCTVMLVHLVRTEVRKEYDVTVGLLFLMMFACYTPVFNLWAVQIILEDFEMPKKIRTLLDKKLF